MNPIHPLAKAIFISFPFALFAYSEFHYAFDPEVSGHVGRFISGSVALMLAILPWLPTAIRFWIISSSLIFACGVLPLSISLRDFFYPEPYGATCEGKSAALCRAMNAIFEAGGYTATGTVWLVLSLGIFSLFGVIVYVKLKHPKAHL